MSKEQDWCLQFFFTSICILRWTLKWESRVRKMARESSNTSGTEETPFLESATHRYCLIAFTNISCVRNTGPAPWRTDSNSCKETTLERSSWDLIERMKPAPLKTTIQKVYCSLGRSYLAIDLNFLKEKKPKNTVLGFNYNSNSTKPLFIGPLTHCSH